MSYLGNYNGQNNHYKKRFQFCITVSRADMAERVYTYVQFPTLSIKNNKSAKRNTTCTEECRYMYICDKHWY